MKRRSIAIVIAALAFGLLYQLVEKGGLRLFENFGLSWDDTRLLSEQAREFPQLQRDLAAVQELVIDNVAGDIAVTPSPDGRLHWQPIIRIYHENQEEAARIAATIRIHAAETQGRLRIETGATGGFPYRRARIHFRVRAPAAVKMVLRNRYGPATIRGAGQEISVSVRYGDVTIEDIAANVDLACRYGKARLQRIQGTVALDCHYATVHVENVAALTGQGKYCDLTIKDSAGKVEMDSAYGRFALDGAESADINARHTPIQVKNIRQGVRLSDSYEAVSLQQVSGDIDLSGRYCQIKLDDCTATTLHIRNNYDAVQVLRSSAESVSATLKKCTLLLSLTAIRDQVTVDGSHCSIRLETPRALQPTLQLKTRYGRIINRTPMVLELQQEGSEMSVQLAGGRPGGRPQIIIDTSYGDIDLSELGDAPEPEKIQY